MCSVPDIICWKYDNKDFGVTPQGLINWVIPLQWRHNGAMASQITSLTIVYSTVYSGADQRKHQSFASLASVRGIHRWPVNFPHKWPVTRKMFPFDVIMLLPYPTVDCRIGLKMNWFSHNPHGGCVNLSANLTEERLYNQNSCIDFYQPLALSGGFDIFIRLWFFIVLMYDIYPWKIGIQIQDWKWRTKLYTLEVR